MFGNSVFENTTNSKKIDRIPDDADIVFVADAFSDQYTGGAELTTDTIIDKSPYNVVKINSKDLDASIMSTGTRKYWIFGNFSSMDLNLIPAIVANLNYSIIEYDYKFCKFRSQEKHRAVEGKDCDCAEDAYGQYISAFFYGADNIFWMSENQKNIYHNLFPFLKNRNNNVISSCFSDGFFKKINDIKASGTSRNEKYIIIGSTSWIKGLNTCKEYCEKNNLEYEIVANLSYENMLEKFSSSRGLVFLPPGKDTCPRVVIEAKLLGCKVIMNENIQHKDEDWFNTDNIETITDYLKNSPGRLWKDINISISNIKNPTISGYTTTLNCIDQDYPFMESILSMMGFCDQVVVVDGGSKDGTWEALNKLKTSLDDDGSNLLLEKRERNWDHKRFAVFDGLQKAYARSFCTGDFCWQMDSDEIVHEHDYGKIKSLAGELPKSLNLLCLPVIEYWGKSGKVRVDVNPWKWRLSRNRSHITHGIPKNLRRVDENGDLYSLPGTDGCDYIDSETYESIPYTQFYTKEIHEIREKSLLGDEKYTEMYENWLNNAITHLPGVHHYSWFNLERKIKTYKNYWSKHWQSLYDIIQEDTIENNMFFDKKWSDIDDNDIKNLSKKLETDMGGWIFHSKIDFNKKTPHIDCERNHPIIMKNWLDKN